MARAKKSKGVTITLRGKAARAFVEAAYVDYGINPFVGQTRSTSLVGELARLGIGECTNRGEMPPRRTPWFLDNGAFVDWRAKRPFDSATWLADVRRIAEMATPPRFAVAPDVVAGGNDSLDLSMSWVGEIHKARVPAYLAVQDGMRGDDVERVLRAGDFAGVFVGGSLPWKLATGAQWVAFAHRLGKPCHIGRVGTPSRVRWAKEIEADSIDSCLPLWSREQLAAFVAALRGNGQFDLFVRREGADVQVECGKLPPGRTQEEHGCVHMAGHLGACEARL